MDHMLPLATSLLDALDHVVGSLPVFANGHDADVCISDVDVMSFAESLSSCSASNLLLIHCYRLVSFS
jgi:hypothetical protein